MDPFFKGHRPILGLLVLPLIHDQRLPQRLGIAIWFRLGSHEELVAVESGHCYVFAILKYDIRVRVRVRVNDRIGPELGLGLGRSQAWR